MRKYSLLHAPLLSFFSKPLYQDVAWQWKGTNLLYLFLLLALCWVPITLHYRSVLVEFLDESAAPVIDQFPTLHIRDGKVSVEEPEPHVITEPESGKPLAIFDTTGETTSLDDSEAMALVTESKLILVQRDQGKTEIHDLSQVKSFDVDRDDVHRLAGTVRRWFFPVCYVLSLIGSYAFRIVQALLYALLGLLFASLLHATLTYSASMRLAIVAATPAIILDAIRRVSGLQIPGWWYIGLAVALGYLLLGVKFAAEAPPEIPLEPAGEQAYPGLPSEAEEL